MPTETIDIFMRRLDRQRAKAITPSYTDRTHYGVLVEYMDGEWQVRDRRRVSDWLSDPECDTVLTELLRVYGYRSNPVRWLSGALGGERARRGIESDGRIYRMDDSGCPADSGWVGRNV